MVIVRESQTDQQEICLGGFVLNGNANITRDILSRGLD